MARILPFTRQLIQGIQLLYNVAKLQYKNVEHKETSTGATVIVLIWNATSRP